MTKKLKQQALYDQAVQALASLGLSPGEFNQMTEATYIAEALTEGLLYDEPPTFEEYFENVQGAAEDNLATYAEDAWYLLEGHDYD